MIYGADVRKAAMEAKEHSVRWPFTEEVIKAESTEFVQRIRGLVEAETLLLGVRATKKADYFWIAQEESWEGGNEEEQCYMGTRVKNTNGTITLEWFKNNFRTIQTPKGKRKQVFSEYIKKDTKGGYGAMLYRGQPKWAQEVMREVEGEYQRVRKRTEILGKMKRLMRDYEALIEVDGQ
jgi:hypothetical protein